MFAAIEVYTVVLFLHVLGAVAFLGPMLVLPVMDAAAQQSGRADELAYWRMREGLGRVIAFGGLVLLLAGLYIAIDADRFKEWWVGFALLALIVILGVGGAVTTPAEKKVVAALEAGQEPDAPLVRRVRLITGLSTVAAVIVLFLMVTQPG